MFGKREHISTLSPHKGHYSVAALIAKKESKAIMGCLHHCNLVCNKLRKVFEQNGDPGCSNKVEFHF